MGSQVRLGTTALARHIVQNVPGATNFEAMRAVQDLIVQGVLLIGSRAALYGLNAPLTATGDWNLPHVTISDYGGSFLASTKDDPDPYDAITILEPLRLRGVANDAVEAYIPESVRALGAGAYRGTFVLIGVAAEAVAEDIYDAFAAHLETSARSKFLADLNAKKNSAEARWTAFISRFPAKHETCLGDELARRFRNVLEPQLKLFKHNRDDAAHRRATLISRETAQAALAGFVPFGLTAADVIAALGEPCTAPP